MTDKQSEALRLADMLNGIPFIGFFAHGQLGTEDSGVCKEAAAELRRLDALNAELVEALKYCRQKIAYMTTHGEWYSPGSAIEKADAAINKAEGK